MDGVGSAPSRITFGGLATGLDTGALIDALIQAERRPLINMQTSRDLLAQRQSLFQQLNGMFLNLRTAAQALDNLTDGLTGPSATEEFLAYSAESSDEAILGVDAGEGAAPGSYSVEVTQRAQIGRRVSNAFAASDTPISGTPGSLTVAFGGTTDISVAVDATTTLVDVADAINTDLANEGRVRADVLFDGSQYRLVVSGTQAGLANDVTLTSDFGAFEDATLAQVASDAQLVVLGVPITRTSNEIGDALPGVTLSLLGESAPGESATVTVSRDDEAIADNVQAFVDAYNAIRDFSIAQSEVNEVTGRAGPLSGNVSLRTLERSVQGVLGRRFAITGTPHEFLSDMGIRFDTQGRLELDQAALQSALDEDPFAVRQLLSGDGTNPGVAAALVEALEPVVRTGDGIFALNEQTFTAELSRMDDRIARFEDRIASREESLIRQFSALESLIASIQAQSGFLGSLSSLNSRGDN